MKHLLSTAALLTTLAHPALAQKNDPIKDQMDLTRGAVQLMIESLREVSSSQGGLEHSDYEETSERFQNNLIAALGKFERDIQNIIINPLSLMIQQYHMVASSTYYSASEKEALLYNLRTAISAFCTSKESDYKKLVVALINTMGIDIDYIQVADSRYKKETGRYRHFFDQKGVPYYDYKSHNSELERVNKAYNEKYDTNFSAMSYSWDLSISYHQSTLLTQGCYTSSCKTLLSVVYKKFVTMLSTNLDRGLAFRLDENHRFAIKPSGGDYSVVIGLINLAAYSDLTALPFVLSLSEMGAVTEMIAAANAQDFGLEDCRTSVRRLKDELYAGPLSKEHHKFVPTIKLSVTNTTATQDQLDETAKKKAERDALRAKSQKLSQRIAELGRQRWNRRKAEIEINTLREQVRDIGFGISNLDRLLEVLHSRQQQDSLRARLSCLDV